jgi:transcription-repair coupling factor (superfamily II helicase)
MAVISTSKIKEIIPLLSQPGFHIELTGLCGSAPAFLLSRLIRETRLPFLIITPDPEKGEELWRELAFYSGDETDILHFPPWDTAPLEQVSPHPDITGCRLNTLFRLMEGKARGVVTPVSALFQKVLPKKVLGNVSQYLVAGEEVERDALVEKLVRLGYANVPLVEDRGTFSVRGGLIDIFPPDMPAPLRIDFFGDFVDTIRTFDPITQRSLRAREELIILPSREVVLTDEVLAAFGPRLKSRCDALEIQPARRRELVEQLKSAIYPPGIEYLQPLFHPELEELFSYMGGEYVTVTVDGEGITAAWERFREEIAVAGEKACDKDIIYCDPSDLYLEPGRFRELVKRGPTIHIPSLELAGSEDQGETVRFSCRDNSDLRLNLSPDSEGVLRPLSDSLSGWLDDGDRVIIACHQKGQAERLFELLAHYGLPLNLSERSFPVELGRRDRRVDILTGEISRGFRLRDEQVAVIAEEEIFGPRVKRRGLTEVRKKQILTSLAELKPGDHMVHLDFGVGIYRGLQHMVLADCEGDFLLLEYAGADKLYLPVDRINLVQRYVGAEGIEPRVDRLGGAAWDKAKAKAREAVQEMARELLAIYAAREVREGHAFSPPDDLFREFEASFAFEETPDQLSAIEDVIRDMESARPMDRLVCGDVGYGKTEVAMRAAFKAVMDGKQVAVLVPTTILAQQHQETFTARFKAYPVRVEAISRFRSPKEQKDILAGVKKGDVDIIIGTHRILQKDVVFKDLGLMIVDEEQRFGVTHKERLKQLRAEVDIITLTATPIPRTLYMSLMGIRDLSIIDTPPVDRLVIKTFVARMSDELIREAVMRELRRGGQVFFVHNRVQSIAAMAEHLRRIVPEAKVAVGHGQMEERELEKVMLGFMHGETNLLLSTTIIESGLDIPTANTLIINRADAFGLAQLYQLRGRVGRSRQRAYAYFLIPGEGAISIEARERLKILQDISELGAGFRIATHDLELRGAGDLLGARQSGNIVAVGFELYTELLEEAVSALKGEERIDKVEPEIKLRIPAFIPEDYVTDPNQRLVIYKKLTQAASTEEVGEIQDELNDRFGKIPVAAGYLLEVMRLRIGFKALLIRQAEFDGKGVTMDFHPRTPVSPDRIIELIRKEPKRYQFTSDFRLIFQLADTSFDGIITGITNLLKRLG